MRQTYRFGFPEALGFGFLGGTAGAVLSDVVGPGDAICTTVGSVAGAVLLPLAITVTVRLLSGRARRSSAQGVSA